MALYGAMFSQYGIKTGQVLVNKVDFYNEYTRENLQATLNELLELNIIPILNTNDAIASKPGKDLEVKGMININDNDSLAARLAVLVESDLLILMSDVSGVYDKPPSENDSHLLHTFNPKIKQEAITFGQKSNVGTGRLIILDQVGCLIRENGPYRHGVLFFSWNICWGYNELNIILYRFFWRCLKLRDANFNEILIGEWGQNSKIS